MKIRNFLKLLITHSLHPNEPCGFFLGINLQNSNLKCNFVLNTMIMTSKRIKIINENFGILVDETFVNETQFKLFLKMIQGCIELKNDLTFFNGTDCFIHIPYRFLVDSIILSSEQTYTLSDHITYKSKIEA